MEEFGTIFLWSHYEDFTEEQTAILEHYVTNTTQNIFVLKNLPEVIKGALFSRYSRSNLGLRSLLLKDFVAEEKGEFSAIVGSIKNQGSQELAIQKAQDFYDRILDGYGDDSIGELGGAHLAAENISMLAAKVIEDCRIGGSPLEKSTRYIYFDKKCKGEYLFFREPILMASAFRDLYLDMCNELFSVYRELIDPLMEKMKKLSPPEEGVSPRAYQAALRAQVLDCLRGLLPVSTLTNMGVFGNGRFFEALLQKLGCSSLAELQEIKRGAFQELTKVIPSFVRRSESQHKHFVSYQTFQERTRLETKKFCNKMLDVSSSPKTGVTLVDFDAEGPLKVAARALYEHSDLSLPAIEESLRKKPPEAVSAILDGLCQHRTNRRHKAPRAAESAFFTFEIVADFGIYRDLQRHRTLSQDRQILTCDLGYYVPEEILNTPMEKPYRKAMEKAQKTYEMIAEDFPEEAQYVIPMAYNVRWYFHVNLRSLQWITELRSSPQGHPAYRRVAQEMAKLACDAVPAFEPFFSFVDFEGYPIGRLGQEIRTEAKKAKNN